MTPRERSAMDASHVCNGPCLCCAVNKLWSSLHADDDYYIVQLAHHEGVYDMALRQRPAPPTVPPVLGDVWAKDEFMDEYPNIFAFLNDVFWESKMPRVPGTITFFTQQGILKATVNDKARNIAAYPTASTWGELLMMIDKGIGDDSLDWKGKKPTESDKKIPY